MVDAEIQGETHTSRKDMATLMELNLSRFDAVFREGSESDFHARKFTVGYTLFAVASLLYVGTYGRLYIPIDEFQDKVVANGPPFYKIDADVHEIYEMVPRWRRILYLLIAPILALLMIAFVGGFGAWIVGLVLEFPEWITIVVGIALFLMFGLIWPFSFFQLIIMVTLDERDDYMAKRVLELSEKHGYEAVLISCGDHHRKGIKSKLEKEGWDVEGYGSASWLGKILFILERLTWPINHPIKALKRVVGKIS